MSSLQSLEKGAFARIYGRHLHRLSAPSLEKLELEDVELGVQDRRVKEESPPEYNDPMD